MIILSSIASTTDINGTGLVLDPVIRDGVITQIPALSKGLGYKSSDLVEYSICKMQDEQGMEQGQLMVDGNGSVMRSIFLSRAKL